MKLFFIHLLSVLISVVEVVTLLMIYMLEFVFQVNLKNLTLKVYNLKSSVNETRFLVQHESCDRKYGLNESVCNLLQKWNHDEVGVSVKNEMIGRLFYSYIWNISMCDCECHKPCKIGEYLDINNVSSII